MKHLKLFFALFAMLALGVGNAWAAEVTYTIATATSVTVSGTAPDGSSATFKNTYTNNKQQLTNGNSMTLTLSGFDGCTITGLTLNMKSNSKAGSGNMSMTIGTTTVASLQGTFKDWNGTYSTAFVDISPNVTSTIVGIGETITITISATANSLYCASFTITYETSSGGSTEPVVSLLPKFIYFWCSLFSG